MADVASALRSWSVTPGSNNPTTSTVVGAGLSGNLQQIQATTRQYLASIGSSVICSATTDLSTVDGYTIPLSGNTTVTSFGTEAAGISYRLQFSGTPLLKNSTAIQCPISADIQIAANDIVTVTSQGSGNWKVTPDATASLKLTSVVTPQIGAAAGVALNLQSNATTQWQIQSAGHFIAVPADNTLDIGLSASGRPRTGYFGTSVVTPTITTPSGGGLSITPAIVATAGQIVFPASQNATAEANTLDDYEEGTWTPSVGGTATYTTQTGTYTKIGNRVSFEADIIINAIGSGSTTTISALPFTVGTATCCCARVSSNSATAIVDSYGRIDASGTSIIIASRTAASAGDALNAIFQNGTAVTFSGSFKL